MVPLTVTPGTSEELLGGGGSQPAHDDTTANRVLVKGEPVPAPPGRADDFVWPLGSDAKNMKVRRRRACRRRLRKPRRRRPKTVARTEPIRYLRRRKS